MESLPTKGTTEVICQHAGHYLAWPTLTQCGDGTLLVTFSGKRDAHVCPFGAILFMRSVDEGQTWSEPEVAVNSPLDDRDGAITECPDGTWVLTGWSSHYADYRPEFERFYLRHKGAGGEARWADWQAAIERVTEGDLSLWASSLEEQPGGPYAARRTGFWAVRSNDRGRTWDQPTSVPVYAPKGPQLMADGSIIFIGLNRRPRKVGDKTIQVVRSTDHGRTWEILADVDSYPPYHSDHPQGFCRLGEPHIAVCHSGKLLALTRSERFQDPADRQRCRSSIWQTESFDNGHTWSQPVDTGIIGKPPHMLVRRDSTILLSYGYRYPPFGFRARLSINEGKSWDAVAEQVVGEESPSSDLGYPSTVELGDGKFLSVYYAALATGEPPVILSSKWQINTHHQ